jgi:hypothetical protein
MSLDACRRLEAYRFRKATGLRRDRLVAGDQRLQCQGRDGTCALESVAHVCQPAIGRIQLGIGAQRRITQQQCRRSFGCDTHPIREIAGLAGCHRAD